MLRILIAVAAVSMLFITGTRADNHPTFYIDRGVCPFECCTYREWRTEKTTKLYAEPQSESDLAGIAFEGDKVTGVTGEVHTKPRPFYVLQDYKESETEFRKGEVVWAYTYLGINYFKLWHRGKFIDHIQFQFDYTDRNGGNWGYMEARPESVWWAKIRLSDGRQGWTDEPGNFSNKDKCA